MPLENEFVFKERPDGKLDFVGDFNGLYHAEEDPWEQSGQGLRLHDYYVYSRNRLISALRFLAVEGEVLEIGCGLGYLTHQLDQAIPNVRVAGLDISSSAVNRARIKWPMMQFDIGDIRTQDLCKQLAFSKKFNVIILSNLLWYVLDVLPKVFHNCVYMLASEGLLVIQQSFLKTPQRYGSEIIQGAEGFEQWLEVNKIVPDTFSFVYVDSDVAGSQIHQDALYVLKLKA